MLRIKAHTGKMTPGRKAKALATARAALDDPAWRAQVAQLEAERKPYLDALKAIRLRLKRAVKAGPEGLVTFTFGAGDVPMWGHRCIDDDAITRTWLVFGAECHRCGATKGQHVEPHRVGPSELTKAPTWIHVCKESTEVQLRSETLRCRTCGVPQRHHPSWLSYP